MHLLMGMIMIGVPMGAKSPLPVVDHQTEGNTHPLNVEDGDLSIDCFLALIVLN
jgi:hypothetical protein